jgi:hypothetical protein
MKIKSIRYAGKTEVFNMEVADTHDYAIENGAIVHNCRYVTMYTKPKIKAPIPIKRRQMYDPLNIRDRRYEGDDNGKVIQIPDIIIGGMK